MKRASVTTFKWLSVMLAVLIVAAAVGCGKKEAEEPIPTSTVSPTTTVPAEPTGETGTLSGLEGDVQVLRAGSIMWEPAISGMKVSEGYGLKTGGDGYVLITFFDGSVMELEADTEISIEELSKTSGGSTTVRIGQVLGNTVNRVENLVDSTSTYEIETPAGSAVVRGTIFEMLVGLYGNLHRACVGTWYEGDGTQHSTDFSGGGSTVNVPEGKTSCCWEGGQPGSTFYTDPADDPYQGGGDGCYGYECGGVGQCAPGCYYDMVGDGTCDPACLVAACQYDCLGGGAVYYQQESGYGVQFVGIYLIGQCDCSSQPCPPTYCQQGGVCEEGCPYCSCGED